MKKTMTVFGAMMVMAISAAAMPYDFAREEALFLSDKMAYELELTEAQYEAVYEINLDYFLNIDCRTDVTGASWLIRNRDLRLVLSDWQYSNYTNRNWFYRPVDWKPNGGWSFSIYSRYGRGRLFNHRPTVFFSFGGGHSHKKVSHHERHRFNTTVVFGPQPRKSRHHPRYIGPNGRMPVIHVGGSIPIGPPRHVIGKHKHDFKKFDHDDD